MPAMAQALREANPCAGDSACRCEPGKYFVTAVDGDRFFLMAGPYQTHQAAEADRDRALKIADDIDGRAWFMLWGVARMPDDCEKVGVLNRHNLI